MAHKPQTTIGELLLDVGIGLAREVFARQFPATAKYLGAGDNYLMDTVIDTATKRLSKRRRKSAPKPSTEIQLADGVFYTPAPGRRKRVR